MPDESTLRGNLYGVQYLRAIAALMVAYYHLRNQIPQYSDFLSFQHGVDSNRLTTGVDIFFIISGFIMVKTGANVTPARFALKRIMRLAPMYWLVTFLLVAIFLVHPSLFRTTTVTAGSVIKSILFIPYVNPGQAGAVVPLLVPGWTLNLEMFFYAVFGVILFAPARYRLALTGVVLTGVYLLPRLIVAAKCAPLVVFADPRIFEFWTGMLIGSLFTKGPLYLNKRESWLLIVAGAAALLASIADLPSPLNDMSGALLPDLFPATAIVYGVLALERAGGIRYQRVACLLGDASYSIYLSHIFAFGMARALWTAYVSGPANAVHAIGFCVSALTLVCLLGIAVYIVIEKPMQRYINAVVVARVGRGNRFAAAAISRGASQLVP